MSDVAESRVEWLNENGMRSFPLVDDGLGKSWNFPDAAVPKWLVRDARAVVVTDSPSFQAHPECFRLVRFKVTTSGEEPGVVSVEADFGVSLEKDDPKYFQYGERNWWKAYFPFSMKIPYGGVAGASGFYDGREHGVPAVASVNVVLGAPMSRDDVPVCHDGGFRDVLYNNQSVGGLPILPSRVVRLSGGLGGLGVSRLKVGDVEASGTIHIADGVNTSFRVVGGGLRLRAGKNLGRRADCWKYDPNFGCQEIRYINGQHADTDGSFQIVGGEGVTIVNNIRYHGAPGVAVVADFEENRTAKYSRKERSGLGPLR